MVHKTNVYNIIKNYMIKLSSLNQNQVRNSGLSLEERRARSQFRIMIPVLLDSVQHR